jgi:hypothetical protein
MARKEKPSMSARTITVTLPEGLYERVQTTARASARSVEEVCAQSIALSLPELEEELSPPLRAELARLSLLSDTELATIAHGMMDDEMQAELETLATLQQQRALTASEEASLRQLMDEARRLMVRKAEAYRLLARRGQPVFSSTGHSLA